MVQLAGIWGRIRRLFPAWDAPAKIRLLDQVRRVFPLWAIERQALVIERAFDSDLAKAKDDSEARHSIIAVP